MGMYTAYRCKAKIKPEYRSLIQGIIYWHSDFGRDHLTGINVRLAKSYPVAREFLACERAQFIFSWMWGDNFKNWGSEQHNLCFEDGWLTFRGCIKNYDHEAQKFAKMLDTIAEKIVFFRTWYEKSYGPSTYKGNGEWEHTPTPRDPYHEPWCYTDTFEEE